MMFELKTIQKPFLILCEGIDECNFLCSFLNSKELQNDGRFSQDIQICNFGGNEELPRQLTILHNIEGYKMVSHILIIRDAETDSNAAIMSIQNALKKNGLPLAPKCCQWIKQSPISTAYCLFPILNSTPQVGTLEDLCWEILKDNSKNEKEEIKQFINHMKNNYHRIVSHEHKSRLHTYFSVDDNLVSMKIGEAAKVGAFNWKHEKLKALEDLIQEGLQSIKK